MKGRHQLTLSLLIFSLVFVVHRRALAMYRRRVGEFRSIDDTQASLAMFKPLKIMTRIALPTLVCREGFFTLLFVVLFGVQAILRLLKTQADGKVVSALIELGTAASKSFAAGGGSGSVGSTSASSVMNSMAASTGKSLLGKALTGFVATAVLEAVVEGCIEHMRMYLISQYRAKLTRYFHGRYFSGLTFYHSAVLDDRIQNVDDQITIFCHEFAEHYAELPYYFLLPGFEALTALFIVVKQVGWKPAAMMTSIVVASMLALKKLQPPFGKMHEASSTREQEFRKLHNDAKMNTEQLALHHAGSYTRRRLDSCFLNVQAAMEQFALATGHFKMLENAVSGAVWDVATLILCGAGVKSLFNGKQPGEITTAKVLSSIIVQRRLITSFHSAVKTFVGNSKELSHLTEYTEKLADFETTLNSITRGRLVKKPDPRFIDSSGSFMMPSKEQVLQITQVVQSPAVMEVAMTEDWENEDTESLAETLRESAQPIVVFDRVSVRTPNGVPLVKDLSFEIKIGESWVVTGPNGTGKSSILRVLAGMWLPRRGKVVLHPLVELFFLPQAPYFVQEATLMDQLFFPNPTEYGVGGILGRVQRVVSSQHRQIAKDAMKASCASQVVSEVLGGWDSPLVGFEADKVDHSFDWSTLSGGQQQKLALARLFFNIALCKQRGRIPLAVMDESTSQMDHESEAVLFKNLRKNDVGVISVSHRDSVTMHHNRVLTLNHSDNWKIRHQKPAEPPADVSKK